MEDFEALVGLRGICSLLIVVGHFFIYFDPAHRRYLSVEYLQAVSLFFLVSGLTLARLYSRKNALCTAAGRADFLWRRFARLAPLYYLALVVGLPGFLLANADALLGRSVLTTLFATPFGLQSVFLVPFDRWWVRPLWQVSVFLLCYAVYAFAAERRIRTASTAQLWLWSAACFALPGFSMLAVQILRPQWNLLFRMSPMRIPHFVLGAILGELLERIREKKSMSSSSQTKWWRCVVDGLSTAFLCTQIASILVGYRYPERVFVLWGTFEFALVPLHFFWLFALVLGHDCGSLTHQVLCSKPLCWLGTGSFAAYALHVPLWQLYAMATKGRISADFSLEPWHLPLTLPLLFAVSGIAERRFSEPMRAWICQKKIKAA